MCFSLFSPQFFPPQHPDHEHMQSVLITYPVRLQISIYRTGLAHVAPCLSTCTLLLLPLTQLRYITVPTATVSTDGEERHWRLAG